MLHIQSQLFGMGWLKLVTHAFVVVDILIIFSLPNYIEGNKRISQYDLNNKYLWNKEGLKVENQAMKAEPYIKH